VERIAKEAIDKVTKEGRKNKYVKTRDNIQPVDIDAPETSTLGTNTQAPFIGQGLGLWAPFQQSEVINMKSFMYDSKSGKIVQEEIKKVTTTQGMLISVLT
jgi:hypothetical protein